MTEAGAGTVSRFPNPAEIVTEPSESGRILLRGAQFNATSGCPTPPSVPPTCTYTRVGEPETTTGSRPHLVGPVRAAWWGLTSIQRGHRAGNVADSVDID